MSTNEFRIIADLLAQGQAAQLVRQSEGRVYVRRFVPEERLIVLGGGHIAQSLCAMGAMLDFSVVVVDDRPEYGDPRRFPGAAQVICADFVSAIDALALRPSDYVCIVTRGHRWDGVCLRRVLAGTQPTYLGMIGSRHRVAATRELLTREGYDPVALAALHAPIGLMIGAVTPAEIAVAICAQLVEHRRSLPRWEKADGLMEQTNTDPALISYLAEDRGPKALLLVLSSSGSTPVKSGAIMAVDAQGRGHGTIGGGWGEARAMERARQIIGTGTREILQVDMDNDVAALEGMACGGAMRVLLEDLTK